MNNDFKGIWIPIKIFHLLKPNFNLVFTVCNHYYFKTKIKYEDWKTLVDFGLAQKMQFSAQEAKDLVSNKQPQKIMAMPANEKCDWCKGNTYRLEEHHFPLSRKEGGCSVVGICAQCHDEYHFLISHFYCLSELANRCFMEIKNDQ